MSDRRPLFLGAVLVATVFFSFTPSAVIAQTEESATEPKQAEENDENLEPMRSLAQTIQVRFKKGDEVIDAKVTEKPLLRFSDPSRAHSDGTVWAWATQGRPVVFAELRTADYREGIWGHDLVLTSEGLASATAAGHGKWEPREADFVMKPFPGAPTPEDSEASRLRQMKQLVRRISGNEEWMGERIELRVLPNPIHRYQDADPGLVDGAVFAFVAGTNPEALLFIEAQKQPSGALNWKYGFARMTAASLSMKLEDDEVYAAPLSFGAADATYYAFTRSAPPMSTTDPRPPSAE